MRRILTCVLILCIAALFFKDASISESLPNAKEPTGSFIALVDDGFDRSNLTQLNLEVGSRIGNIITLHGQSSIEEINKISTVHYVHEASKIKPNLSRARLDMRLDSVSLADSLELPYSGKDVLIGITDWGFDYGHPTFYDTSLTQLRIAAAWDQFKTSGPHPAGFSYGAEYDDVQSLLTAQSDTAGLYDYAFHGTHVGGIAGGSGGGLNHRGVAYNSQFLMVSVQLDEAGVLDAFAWMKEKADKLGKRLVVNMSWGLYYIGPMDGTSLISQAIDEYSEDGVIFVTSAGNNGGEQFHIKKEFDKDTLHTGIGFYTYTYPLLWGQSISMWGETGMRFNSQLLLIDSEDSIVHITRPYSTHVAEGYIDTAIILDSDTVFYNISKEASYSLNNRPTMRLRVRNKNTVYRVGLRVYADSGILHLWNVVELTNDAGNWGGTFDKWYPGWVSGDDTYSLGEPACTKSVVTVAAHSSEVRLQNGNVVGGRIANFSSKGPTIDERRKPDISAPGVSIASSVSSYTTRNYDLLESVDFNGRSYPFARLSGTSMSSPAVAGVVALLLEANPRLNNNDVQLILQQSARLDQNTGEIRDTSDLSWGWGKVNALKALQLAEKYVPSFELPYSNTNVLFPNPANSKLYFGSINAVNVKIYSAAGALVNEGLLSYDQGMDVTYLNSGSYYVRIDNTFTVKLLIIH